MKLSRFPIVLAGLAGLLLLISGPGVRLGLWQFPIGFQLMRWAVYVGLAAAALAVLMDLIPKTRTGWIGTLAALVVGLFVAYLPWHLLQHARSVPPIHDITTDFDNPPAFVAVLPQRATVLHVNPVEYGGPEVAEAQRKAYPDIQPLILDLPPAAAFDKALAAAKAMCWEIVASDPAQGHLEATATTPWFGFKDDVVVRITAAESGSRVDVRSLSRIGKSDVGANAKRIRAYFAKLAG